MNESAASPQGSGLLRAARRERGWSQTRAAAELTGLAAERGVPVAAPASLKTQLSRWENGHALPDSQYRELLGELYARPVHELGLQALESIPAANQRDLLGRRLSTAAALDDETVAALRSQVESNRRMDRRLGAAASAGAVGGQLSDLELLLAHCLLPDRRRSVAALLAEAAVLAAAQSLDLGAVEDAWRHLELAGWAAREARSAELASAALAGQAEVLLEIGRADDAVLVARRALAEAPADQDRPLGPESGTGSAAVPGHRPGPGTRRSSRFEPDERPATTSGLRAAVLACLGVALAEAGDAIGSRQALDLAEQLGGEDSPRAVEVDLPAVHRARGHALSVLGESGAVPALEIGLRAPANIPVRERAAAYVDLAVALRAAGRGPDAVEQAGRARELAERIGSERLRARLDRALAGAGRR